MKAYVSILFSLFLCFSNASCASLVAQKNRASTFEELIKKVYAGKKEQLSKDFDAKYLSSFDAVVADFLPNAKIICEQVFPLMTAAQIAAAINVLVNILDKKWTVYFDEMQNKELSRSKLNALIKECEIFSNFLKTAKIALNTTRLISKTGDQKNSILLRVYMKQQLNNDAFFRLHAILLDLLFIKMYSFAMQSPQNYMVLKNFEKTKTNIEIIVQELNGSKYERYYKEKVKTAQTFLGTFTQLLEHTR